MSTDKLTAEKKTDKDHSVGSPLVSVQVCCYNSEPFLRDTLDSLIAQTYPHWEGVVVDDGSTDGTRGIVREYAARDSRIRYTYHPNQGLANTRNRAIELSTGSLIAFLDHDDIWAPDKLARQVPVFEDDEIGFVYSDAYRIDSGGARCGTFFDDTWFKLPDGPAFEDLIDFCPPLLTVVVRKVPELRFNPTFRIVNDHDLWLVLAERWKVRRIDERLASYRVHAGQGSAQRAAGLSELFVMYRSWAYRVPDGPLRKKLGEKAHESLGGVAASYLRDGDRSEASARFRYLLDKVGLALLLRLPGALLRTVIGKIARQTRTTLIGRS